MLVLVLFASTFPVQAVAAANSRPYFSLYLSEGFGLAPHVGCYSRIRSQASHRSSRRVAPRLPHRLVELRYSPPVESGRTPGSRKTEDCSLKHGPSMPVRKSSIGGFLRPTSKAALPPRLINAPKLASVEQLNARKRKAVELEDYETRGSVKQTVSKKGPSNLKALECLLVITWWELFRWPVIA